MKVLILGHGAVGSVLVKLLSEEKNVESIVCGDISFKEDLSLINKIGIFIGVLSVILIEI